jgi:hypothetical protein
MAENTEDREQLRREAQEEIKRLMEEDEICSISISLKDDGLMEWNEIRRIRTDYI